MVAEPGREPANFRLESTAAEYRKRNGGNRSAKLPRRLNWLSHVNVELM